MSIKEYLPQYLQEVEEFEEICKTEDIELEELNSKIEEMLNEIIVNKAKGYGLDRYERIYNIIPKSSNIEERRFNILSKMNNKVPFTLNWLRNKLETLVGKDNYRINIDYANYSVTIEVSMIFENIANTLNVDLREQLPANMLITVNLFQTENAKLYVGAIMRQGDYMKIGGMN